MRRPVVLFAMLSMVVCARAADAAPPPLEAYGRLPAVDSATLSPSGERFAVIDSDKDGRVVYVRQTADGKAIGALRFAEGKLRRLAWAGEDHLLIFNTSTQAFSEPGAQKGEWEGLINFDLRTGKAVMLLAKSPNYVDAIFGWYGAAQVNGRWYAYVGGVGLGHTEEWSRSAIFADLDRIDLDNGKVEVVVHSSERSRSWLVSSAGEVLAHTLYDTATRTSTLYAGAAETRQLAQAVGKGRELDLAGLGRRPGTLLVREETDGKEQLRELPADGSGPGEVLLADAAASGPIFDRDSRLLIGFASLAKSVMFDKPTEKRINDATAPFGGDRSELVAFSRDFKKLIFSANGPRNPGRFYLVDLSSRAAVPIGDTRPDIGPDQIGPVSMTHYKADDGLEMDGVLTLPPGREAKGLPLVVMPHGGPIVEGDTVSFDWWAQAFASRGYAVFQPNYRGTLGYGDAFRKAAAGQFGRKMQTDISDGVAALAKAGTIDPKRVCIVGASYGGYAALAGVTLQQGLYRCAVAVAGVADMRKMLEADIASRDRRALEFWRGLSSAKSQDLDAISPARLAAKADAPILLIHGENDTVVPIEQSKLMERALRQAGKPVELVTMAGEDHWLSNAATRQQMLNRAVAFVQQHDPAN
ncbi:alpha/beta hydrolase family protein [Phenylobacterium sp.]|uniref:alpha/beta hydrolase family protein n=1 Tax=Phenylobacterium sp. TaxID=1871053 RepID=UPI00374D394A